MPDATNLLLHAGRALVALLFILAAVNKIVDYGATGERMAAAGLQPVALLLPATIVLEGVAGLFVLLGRSYAMPAAVALAAFTIATNVVFHRFWEFGGPARTIELSLFFKNVAIAGALLYIAATSRA
jgi:putative oxidoreductase